MSIIGQGPFHDMARELSARQKAREDHAYEQERAKLKDRDNKRALDDLARLGQEYDAS